MKEMTKAGNKPGASFGYNAAEVEQQVLEYWKQNNIYQKAKEKNLGKDRYYFLDGPPYTSGRVHIGTAWNKALKDLMLRYQRMRGKDVFDRACYDMHGLPIEHRVQEKHKLKTKEDIIKFGMAKFIEECRKFAVENLHIMNEEFWQMGAWLDYENSYMPITEEAMEGIWWLIKKVHEQGRLYEGHRSMTWCSHCATALAKHELEYQEVSDNSIFVKLKVKGKENEYLVVWTTTPWTIPFDLAVMVHPDIQYQRCVVQDAAGKGKEEVWIVAKALANVFISGVADKKYTVKEELKGEKLHGLEYDFPIALPQYEQFRKEGKRIHRVVLSEEYVDTTAGTGLVHCAPGCGPQDYEVGHREGLPIWNVVDETGIFPKEMTPFAGLQARIDDKHFTKVLEEAGAVITKTPVKHEYPHCWRCHKPVIFRTTKQWFFKVEDLKEQMIAENKKVRWTPEAAFNAFDSWLKNLRDNSITKQRFWGTPLPVWRCEKCGDFEVLATKTEIEKKWGKKLQNLHKPWIDEAQWKCKCGGLRQRIPDVMDVWIDPGCLSWTALGYPQSKKEFDALFPADFILEGKDQIRGWFNVLMVCSMLALRKPSFKSVYMHGFVQDALGRKMSKSLGNIVAPEEVIAQYGADTLRYYTIGGALPGLDLSYNIEDAKAKHRNLGVLWNLHKFLLDYARTLEVMPDDLDLPLLDKVMGVEEQYMLSKLHSTIRHVTKLFDEHLLNEIPAAVEELFLTLSRTYIQLVREKSASGEYLEKQAVLHVISETLKETLKLFAPVCPFICERVYLDLREAFGWKAESVHLLAWPEADEEKIDPTLERQMDLVQQIIAATLNGREKIKMGVRWPLAQCIIVTQHEETIKALEDLGDLFKSQTNVRELHITPTFPKVKQKIRADFSQLGPDFGDKAPKIIAQLSMESPESILSHIAKEGYFTVKVDSAVCKIVKEHLIVEREVPYPYTEVGFKHGILYLNQERSDALEAEGYAREIMRRIQQARKEAGLVKTDKIDLTLQVSPALQDMLSAWETAIKEKVGAKKLTFAVKAPKMQHCAEAKIKQESFVIAFEKV